GRSDSGSGGSSARRGHEHRFRSTAGLPDYLAGSSGHSVSNHQRAARFVRVFGDSAGWPIAVPQASPFPRRLAPTRRPNRVHGVLLPRRTFVTDWSFSFHCSPPRVAATQLRFATIRFSTAWERTSTAPTQRLLRRTRDGAPSRKHRIQRRNRNAPTAAAAAG